MGAHFIEQMQNIMIYFPGKNKSTTFYIYEDLAEGIRTKLEVCQAIDFKMQMLEQDS